MDHTLTTNQWTPNWPQIINGPPVTRKKSNFKMEDSTFIIIQLFVVLTVIAGNLIKTLVFMLLFNIFLFQKHQSCNDQCSGLLSWVVRGLLCKVPGEPAGASKNLIIPLQFWNWKNINLCDFKKYDDFTKILKLREYTPLWHRPRHHFPLLITIFCTGRVVLVTGCDTGIGHEVKHYIIWLFLLIQSLGFPFCEPKLLFPLLTHF